MYSKEFLKFLYGYQKEDFKNKEPKSYNIRFRSRGGGKTEKVYITVESNYN